MRQTIRHKNTQKTCRKTVNQTPQLLQTTITQLRAMNRCWINRPTLWSRRETNQCRRKQASRPSMPPRQRHELAGRSITLNFLALDRSRRTRRCKDQCFRDSAQNLPKLYNPQPMPIHAGNTTIARNMLQREARPDNQTASDFSNTPNTGIKPRRLAASA